MKRFTRIVCLILLALLLIAAAPVTATTTTIPATDSITTISPRVGYTDNKLVTYTITGNNFTTVQGKVWLEMSGETDIEAYSITSWTSNTIVCKFKFSSSKTKGDWDVVIEKKYVNGSVVDTNYIVKPDYFAVAKAVTITSITPASGGAGDDNIDFKLVGTNFDEDNIDEIFLFHEGYDNLTTNDYTVDSSTLIKGTFDLSDAEEGKYDVCIKDTYGLDLCDLTYTVNTNKVGSIDFSSSPTGATIYIDGIANGTTPNTVDDVIVGSHKIILKKSGYEDWGKIVSVTEGDTSEVDAKLYAAATATPATASPTAVPTSRPTTARTTAKSTIKVPTTWADTPATTAASPVDPAVVIGAAGIGIGLAVFRRR